MSKYSALVSSIAANPDAHLVDKEKKMSDTVDVMCKNRDVLHSKFIEARVLSNTEVNRGYGERTGRSTGD